LHTFDLNTGKEGPIVNVRAAVSFFNECAFSPTAKHVACCERDSELAVCDGNSGKRVFTIGLPGRARKLSFAPDGRTLAAAVEGKIVLVEIATGKVRTTFAAKAQALTF